MISTIGAASNANKYFDTISLPFNESLFRAAVSHLANFNSYRAEKTSRLSEADGSKRAGLDRDGDTKKEVIKK